MALAIIAFVSFFLTFAGVEMIRRWSLKKDLLDIPNSRSSHTVPTPRGGGAAIVLVCLSGYILSSVIFGSAFYYSFFIGSLLIAIISLLDDLFSISFVYRLAVHSVAAAGVIYEIGYFGQLTLPLMSSIFTLGFIGIALTFFWIIWTINAYNFMDGIDGIAGSQAIITILSYLLLVNLWGISGNYVFLTIALSSCFGFLALNWPPAKIFMGDTGSSFLGFTFSVLPVMIAKDAGAKSSFLPIIAAAFLWPFIFDTIFTFLRRLINKETVWKAHRGHLYQRMTNRGYAHKTVTSIYGLITIVISGSAIMWTERGSGFLFLLCLTASIIIIFLLARKSGSITAT